MTALLIVSTLIAVLIIGLLAGVVGGHILLLPSDRRRLEIMSRAMFAEQRVEDMTRSTLQAMRDAARRRA